MAKKKVDEKIEKMAQRKTIWLADSWLMADRGPILEMADCGQK